MFLFIDLPAGGAFLILFLLAFLGLYLFYLFTLQQTLKIISIENQQMKPGNVWLLLIPLFSFFWQFVVVTKMADSLKAEGLSKNIIFDEARPGYNIGIAMSLVNCLCLVQQISSYAAFASLGLWIVYWVKISGYKKNLLNAANNQR